MIGGITDESYIRRVNLQVPAKVIDMLPFYLSEGQAEGVRGDIAFAQSCIETGNFGFKGSAVTLDQNNFAGIGVTSNGMKGNSWATPQLGIRAQVQHLKAYGSVDPLNQEILRRLWNGWDSRKTRWEPDGRKGRTMETRFCRCWIRSCGKKEEQD